MSVPSWQFLAFALAGALVYNLPFGRAWRAGVWLVMNLIFVWSFAHGIVPLLPLAGFLALGYAGLHTARTGRGRALWLPMVVVLAAFIWLKRYAFIPSGLLLPTGFMTIGISYIFFRVMHLVIDAGEGAKERTGIIGYINFTLNFPALVSGPIQRYEDYLANASLALNVADAGWAIWRMVLGGFKVLIVSAVLHAWQLDLLAGFAPDLPVGQRAVSGALIVVLYPLFLFANFSGYTDFVIGIARLYRLRLPENFDHPFSATNFINFWSRWHISLSQWLRSYVFNPLLMTWMRRKKFPRQAISQHRRVLRNVLPRRRLAWPDIGIPVLRRAAGWRGGRQPIVSGCHDPASDTGRLRTAW
jgi:D-alanyl-lipoteichoic acid acyltransferase DltB (MBOAT superfamily)